MIHHVCPHCRATVPVAWTDEMFNCESCGKLVRPGQAVAVERARGESPLTSALLRLLILLGVLVGAVALLLWINPDDIRGNLYDTLMDATYAVTGKERPSTSANTAAPSKPASGDAAVADAAVVDTQTLDGGAASGTAGAKADGTASAGPATAAATAAPATPAAATARPVISREALPRWLQTELKRYGIYAYVNANKATLIVRSPECGAGFLLRLEGTPDVYRRIGEAGFREIECRSAAGVAERRDVLPVAPVPLR